MKRCTWSDGYIIPVELRAKVEKDLIAEKKPLLDFTLKVNLDLDRIRENIRNSNKYIPASESAYKKLIIVLLNDVMNVNCQEHQIDWNQLELFIKTWSTFFNYLESSQNSKLKPNDLFDLFNLIYVGKTDMYYTLDNKWLGLIKNSGLEHYLYRNK